MNDKMIDKNQIKKMDVLVIDYGVGNHLSITNALEFLGYSYSVSNKKEDIENAQAYILPGVGAFGHAMKNLNELGVIDVLIKNVTIKKKPILGICLGMQILANESLEKGKYDGLGLIPGSVIHIKGGEGWRVPHVGWNNVKIIKRYPLYERLEEEPHYYFDHSYHFVCDKEYISAKCFHGEVITASIQNGNVFGVQFHPEKSQNNGLRLYRGFFDYVRKNNA